MKTSTRCEMRSKGGEPCGCLQLLPWESPRGRKGQPRAGLLEGGPELSVCGAQVPRAGGHGTEDERREPRRGDRRGFLCVLSRGGIYTRPRRKPRERAGTNSASTHTGLGVLPAYPRQIGKSPGTWSTGPSTWTSPKSIASSPWKTPFRKCKDKPWTWETVFVKHIFNKGLVSRIYKEPSNSTSKKMM